MIRYYLSFTVVVMFVTLFSWLNKTFQIFMTAQNTVLGEYSSSISMREEMRKTVPNRTVNKEPQPYLLKNTYKNELGSSSPHPLDWTDWQRDSRCQRQQNRAQRRCKIKIQCKEFVLTA